MNHPLVSLLQSPGEEPSEIVIDLVAIRAERLVTAILNAPRFQELYAAGGVLDDAVSNVCAWLAEPVTDAEEPPFVLVREATRGERNA